MPWDRNNELDWAPEVPLRYLNISGWWDMTDAANRTVVAGRVTQLNDLSGLGRHLVEVGASGPAENLTGWMGTFPTMIFDGATDYLQAPAVAADFAGNALPVTVIYTIRQNAVGTSDCQWGLADSTANTPFHADISSNTSVHRVRRSDDAGGAVTANGSATNTDYIVKTHLYDGNVVSTFLNNVVDINAAPMNTGVCNNLNTFGIGALLNNPIIWYAPTRISEMIIYARELTYIEHSSVANYLLNKWGTT